MKATKYTTMLALAASVAIWVACGDSQKPGTTESTSNKYNPELLSDADKQLIESAKKFFEALPSEIDNPNNQKSEAKVALGKALYYDARLSKSGVISCNSCHNLASYGVDNLPTSPGHKWTFGARNSPTSLNAAFHFVQFWDGRAADLEEQAKGPILNPVEMAIPHEGFALHRLASIPEYKEAFQIAFPNDTNPLTYNNVAFAIAAFERTLVTPAPFDEYLKGDGDAMNDQEKRGLQTFIKTGCTACHSGVVLGAKMYQKFGATRPYWELTKSKTKDEGRSAITKNEGEKYFFKVPSLRNVDRTYPYFHDGSVWDLKEAIAIMGELQLGKKLTSAEVDDIAAFMHSLTGEVPEQARLLPVLPASTGETDRPQFN
jgi:cytochrome c peroxidase